MKPQVLRKPIITDELCNIIRDFQLKALEYGSVITTTSNPYGEEFTHLYRLNYVAEGHVFYKCFGKTIRIESNTLVFLPRSHDNDFWHRCEVYYRNHPLLLYFAYNYP